MPAKNYRILLNITEAVMGNKCIRKVALLIHCELSQSSQESASGKKTVPKYADRLICCIDPRQDAAEENSDDAHIC